MALASVYGLLDPRTSELRYIGQSVDVKARLRHHRIPRNLRRQHHAARWMRELRDAGLMPEVEILEETDRERAYSAEQFWISYFRFIGSALTNTQDRGPGGSLKGWHHTEEAKAKIRAARALQPDPRIGTKHSPETLAKLSAWQTGGHLTPDHRDAISRGLLGKIRGPYKTTARADSARRVT